MLPPDCVRVTGAVQPGLAPGASTVASGLTLCELKLLSPHGLMRPALFPTLFADPTWRREHFESLRYAVSARRTTPRPRWHRARVARDPQTLYQTYLGRTRSNALADALGKAAEILGEGSVDIQGFIGHMALAYRVRHSREGDECLLYQTGNFRPRVHARLVHADQWRTITDAFRSGDDEIEATRFATRQFEMLIPHYRHDIGGWLGNLYPISLLLGRRVTVCTDEAFTVLYLLESLQAHGLLREYRPEGRFAVRGRKFPFHHYAAVLMDSGGHELVVDSWLSHGGSGAQVFDVADWKGCQDCER